MARPFTRHIKPAFLKRYLDNIFCPSDTFLGRPYLQIATQRWTLIGEKVKIAIAISGFIEFIFSLFLMCSQLLQLSFIPNSDAKVELSRAKILPFVTIVLDVGRRRLGSGWSPRGRVAPTTSEIFYLPLFYFLFPLNIIFIPLFPFPLFYIFKPGLKH